MSIALFTVQGCSTVEQSSGGQLTQGRCQFVSDEQMSFDANAFALLHEQAVTKRQIEQTNLEKYVHSLSDTEPLSPEFQQHLNESMSEGLIYVNEYEAFKRKYACYYEHLEMDPDNESLYLGYIINFASTLALQDTYNHILLKLAEVDRLRLYSNEADLSYGKESGLVERLIDKAQSVDVILRLRDEIRFYERASPNFAYLRVRPNLNYVFTSIEQSYTFNNLDGKGFFEYAGRRHNQNVRKRADDRNEVASNITGRVSGAFGNLIGAFESRKGHLYGDATVYRDVTGALQPGDILLEKTPFRLTDAFIPGYWGHAAVWVGSDRQLKELGIWNHSIVLEHHESLLGGESVAEALRDGVQLNALKHFLNVDDLLVIRKTNMTPQEQAQVVLTTIKQLGKGYDFNYNVETTNKLVCSQLVYMAYPSERWPTERILGRYTISPDNIAVKVVDDHNFEVVMMYLDSGKKGGDLEQVLTQLINEGRE